MFGQEAASLPPASALQNGGPIGCGCFRCNTFFHDAFHPFQRFRSLIFKSIIFPS